MKLSLKFKMLLGTAAISISGFVFLMIVIVYIINAQNIQTSQQFLKQAFQVIQDDLAGRQATLLDNTRQLAAIKGVDSKTTYLSAEKSKMDVVHLVDIYRQLTLQIYPVARVTDAWKVGLYDLDRDLLAFAMLTESEDVLGYVQGFPAPVVTFAALKPGETLTDHAWQKVADFSAFGAVSRTDLPERETVRIESLGPVVGLVADAPIMGSRFSKATQAMEAYQVGVVTASQRLDNRFVNRLAHLTGVKLQLFAGNQLTSGDLPDYRQLAPDVLAQLTRPDAQAGAEPIFFNEITVQQVEYFQGILPLYHGTEYVGAIAALYSKEIARAHTRQIINAFSGVLVVSIVMLIGAGVLFSHAFTKPIQQSIAVATAVANGNLTVRLPATRTDEIGMLAQHLNQMIYQLCGICGQVKTVAVTIKATADTIWGQMQALLENMTHQDVTVNTTTATVGMIKRFVDEVAQKTSELLATAEYVFGAIQETLASIEEVTKTIHALTDNLHLISASVTQVNHSIKHIAENTGHLDAVAHQTGTDVQQIDHALNEVADNANQTQQLAAETRQAALQGQMSVEASMQGMQTLQAVVTDTTQVIREVNSWGTQVNTILEMVDDITGQTALLALNAAIISAQAGEHGRGFAVVASEIKELADRTKSSTKEIGALVHALQKKTEEGVKQMEGGLHKTEEQMHLAQAVKETFTTILDSATRSSNRAAETVQVVQETVSSSRTIRAAMNNVTDMVADIRQSIQQEEGDIEQVRDAVENISGMAEELSRASLEQQQAAEHIFTCMEQVTTRFSDISTQTEELTSQFQQIVTAMQTIGAITGETLHDAAALSGDTVKSLGEQAKTLQQVVSVFKIQ